MKNTINQSYGASQYLFDNAKALRKKSTTSEQLFWQIVRNRKIMDLKFRRQHPLKYFIADFYCHEVLLVIELDGGIHELETIIQNDQRREAIIRELGITVLRFTNDEIFSEVYNVIDKIEKHVVNFLPKNCINPTQSHH